MSNFKLVNFKGIIKRQYFIENRDSEPEGSFMRGEGVPSCPRHP